MKISCKIVSRMVLRILLFFVLLPSIAKWLHASENLINVSQLLEICQARDLAIKNIEVAYTYIDKHGKDYDMYNKDFDAISSVLGQTVAPVTKEAAQLDKIVQKYQCVYREEARKYWFKTESADLPGQSRVLRVSDGKMHLLYQPEYSRVTMSSEKNTGIPLYINYITKMPDWTKQINGGSNLQTISDFVKSAISNDLLRIQFVDRQSLIFEAFSPREHQKDIYTGRKISIDLQKGGCIKRIEMYAAQLKDGKFSRKEPKWIMDVTGFIQAQNGVWIPKSIAITDFSGLPLDRDKNALLRPRNFNDPTKIYEVENENYEVTSVKINAYFSKEDFILRVPKGTAVRDQLSGTTFVAGDEISLLENGLP